MLSQIRSVKKMLYFSARSSPIVGSAEVTAAQIADMKAGMYYINLHTAANPGGEIRGQIK